MVHGRWCRLPSSIVIQTGVRRCLFTHRLVKGLLQLRILLSLLMHIMAKALHEQQEGGSVSGGAGAKVTLGDGQGI